MENSSPQLGHLISFMIFSFQILKSDVSRGELYQQVQVIRLNLCLVCRAVSFYRAAFFAFVNDDISLFRVGFHPYRAHDTAAWISSVSRVYIDMERAEASRAMIARTVAERLNLKPAVFADERVVVFCKKLLLRISHLRIFFSIYYATKKAFCQVFHLTFTYACAILQV